MLAWFRAPLRSFATTAAGWLVAAVLGDWFFPGPHGAALWLPSGVALAVLASRPGRWPSILAAVAAAAAVFESARGAGLAQVAVLSVAHVAEPALAWIILASWHRRKPTMSPVAVDRLLLVMLPVAAVGALSAVLWGADLRTSWAAHYVGTVLAASIMSAGLAGPIRVAPRWARVAEAALLATTLWVVAHVVFADWFPGSFRPFPYAMLPVLVWAALRFGVAPTGFAVLAVSYEAFHDTLAGSSPFAVPGQAVGQQWLQTQLFLACVGFSVLVLARALGDRVEAVAALQRVESALQRKQELSRQSEAAAHVGSWRFEIPMRTVQFSPEALRLVGLPETSCAVDLGAAVERLVHPEDRAGFLAALERTASEDRIRSHEFRLRRADGTERILRTEGGTVVKSASGEPLRLFGIVEDVTEQRRVEAALRESEERYRGVFEGSPTVMLVLDPETGAVVDANPAACAFYGRAWDEMRSLRIYDINALPAAEVAVFVDRARQSTGLRYEFKHRLASGELRDVFVYSGPVRVGGRTLLHSVIHDVTESRRAEEAARRGLREAGATLRSVIDATPLGVMMFDGDLRVRLVNPAAREIFAGSTEDIEGRAAADLLGQDHVREVLLPAVEGRPVVGAEIEHQHSDGTPIALRAFAGPVKGFEGDTRGVAHDFNNLLTVVLGHTERALRKLPSESPARPHLERALPAVEQAIVLAGKMLTYAGGSRPAAGPLDLAALVRDDRALLEAAVPPHVTLHLDLEPGAPGIEASAEEVRQAVTALLSNAVEAIGGRRGKIRLRVSTRSIPEGDMTFSRHTGRPLSAGEYVLLEVTDDGGGIRPQDMPRLFDPFFTSKFVGRGLGLAAVLGIMRGHRGGVAVDSAPGQGARFELVFPALATAVPATEARA